MTHAPLLALLLLAAACGGTQAYVPPGVLADLDEAEAQTDDVDDIDVNSETEPIPLEENEVDDDVTEVVDVAELEDVVEAIDLVELPDDEPEGEMNEEEAEIEIELTGRGACWIDNDCRSGEKCADAGAEAGVCYREPPSAQTMKVYRDQEEWNTIDGKQKWDKSLHVCNASASSSACFDGPDFEEIDSSTSPTNLLGYIRFFGFEAACGQTYVDLFTERDGAGNPTNLDCSSNHLRPATVPDCAGRDGWLRGSAVHEWNHLRDGQPYTRCYVFFEGIESGRPSIPTGRRLIFKATAASSGAPVRDTYQYNIYIKPDDAVTADRGTQKDGYRLEINVISKPSYNLIPTTAGLASGIDAERGMLAGTLRDCNGLRIKGGSVGVVGERFRVVYFNANPDNLLPNVTQPFTNEDGTFASVDHEAGVWRIVASAYHGGRAYQFTSREVRVYPGSVTWAKIGGNQPSNYPQQPEDEYGCRLKADGSGWECIDRLPPSARVCP
jgi:hypothetical protein